MRSLFFAPVYNQIEELPAFLAELKAAPLPCDEMLLINNGSTDGCGELIRQSGFPHLDFDRNGGVGFSFVKAIDYALERGFDVLGVLASNGKMLPCEMSRVLDPILQDRADLVTGSRFMAGGSYPHLPLFRRTSIPLVNILAKLTTGARLTDSTCGYRAFRLDILGRADFDWRAPWLYTYGFEYYLYAKVILDGGLRWQEVPVTMRYPPKGRRYSKITPGRDWWELTKPWIMARMDGKGFRKPS